MLVIVIEMIHIVMWNKVSYAVVTLYVLAVPYVRATSDDFPKWNGMWLSCDSYGIYVQGRSYGGGGGGATCPPPPTKKSCIYNFLCFNLLFRICVNTLRPHQNHAYVFLKYSLKYAYLIVFMPFIISPPPPPSSRQNWWSGFFFFVFFACQLVKMTFFGGGGGGGLVSSKFECPPMKTKAPPLPTGKILATPLPTWHVWGLCGCYGV